MVKTWRRHSQNGMGTTIYTPHYLQKYHGTSKAMGNCGSRKMKMNHPLALSQFSGKTISSKYFTTGHPLLDFVSFVDRASRSRSTICQCQIKALSCIHVMWVVQTRSVVKAIPNSCDRGQQLVVIVTEAYIRLQSASNLLFTS
ncbi:hypothetical protein EPI10_025712 [Gossypium australe]|uniref:Uncharacterized protein n=1 Tax=Gossypium australe TaxID=47621 RepID=A0A5B6W361_9ROSI|nr:hypothetical protein EPI10_025712 [Gossypium australe]